MIIHRFLGELVVYIHVYTSAMLRHEVGEPELTIYACACCGRGVLHDWDHKHTYTRYKLNS